jgi:hypothetical protein
VQTESLEIIGSFSFHYSNLLKEYTRLIFDFINKHSLMKSILLTNVFFSCSVMPITAHPAFDKVCVILMDEVFFLLQYE